MDSLDADRIDRFVDSSVVEADKSINVAADYVRQHRGEFAASVAAQVELSSLRDRQPVAVRRTHVHLEPPDGWHNPVSGRPELAPDPRLVHLGRCLRRGRAYVGISQQRLSDACGVSQSMISRAERALAPAMQLERLVSIGSVLGRAFPIGFCPHEHNCAWQPIKPPERQTSDVERLLALILETQSD